MDEFILRSYEGSARLTLSRLVSESEGWITFSATIEDHDLRASCVVDDMGTSALVEILAETADEYRGWEGTKQWESLEEHLAIEATSDRSGHAFFRIALRRNSYDGWRAEVIVKLDVMQRERAAKELARFFDLPTP